MPLFTYSFSPSICELKKKHSTKKKIKRSVTPIKKNVTHKTISRRPRTISRHPRTVSRPPRTVSRKPVISHKPVISRKAVTRVNTIKKQYSTRKGYIDNDVKEVIDVQPGKPKYVSETKHETWVCGYDDGVCKLVKREFSRGGDPSIKFPESIEKKDTFEPPKELLKSLSKNSSHKSTTEKTAEKTTYQREPTNGYPLINANNVKLLDLAMGVDGSTYCAVATSNNSKKWEKCGSSTSNCDC